MLACRAEKSARGRGSFCLVFLVLCSLTIPQAQQTSVPVVTFTCDFPGSDPEHYAVTVTADGHGSYTSNGKVTSQAEATSEDSFHEGFAVSSETVTRIFQLAKQAHYFEGDIDLKKKGLASTGSKTLAYKNGEKSTQAGYNYSPIPAVQELTTLFQNLSSTLEFGQRLQFDLQYQKLALNEELQRMQELADQRELEELSAVAPILEKISQDPAVMNVARTRALRLLEVAKAGRKQ